MSTELALTEPITTVPAVDSAACNPAAVYIASLATGSRRTMAQALETIAKLAANDELASAV
jgi:hypothetical protein